MQKDDPFWYKRDAKLQARLTAEVEALAKLPGNNKCADCSEGRRVRFVSISLGVFLCNRCYGLHRALGAHITRTKCLGLDAWSPEEVETLRSIGNLVSNAQYEARGPDRRPMPISADAEVAKFIREKYEHRTWFDHAAVPGRRETAAAPTPASVRTVPQPSAQHDLVDLLGSADDTIAVDSGVAHAHQASPGWMACFEDGGAMRSAPPAAPAAALSASFPTAPFGAPLAPMQPWQAQPSHPQPGHHAYMLGGGGGPSPLQPSAPPPQPQPRRSKEDMKEDIMRLFN